MFGLLIGLGGIASIVLLSEFLQAAHVIRAKEVSRKIVHITSGVFAASWPFFMPLWAVRVMAILMLAVIFLSKRLTLFRSIHGVNRRTYGELLFPCGILFSSLFAQNEWIYAAAVLHLSLADGFAAIVGVKHLRHSAYKIFGHAKTIQGTLTFYLISLLITLLAVILSPESYAATAIVLVFWLPLSATFAENVAIYGTDNILVPAIVITGLNLGSTVV